MRFMHDLYIAEIYRPGPTFSPLIVGWISWQRLLYSSRESTNLFAVLNPTLTCIVACQNCASDQVLSARIVERNSYTFMYTNMQLLLGLRNQSRGTGRDMATTTGARHRTANVALCPTGGSCHGYDWLLHRTAPDHTAPHRTDIMAGCTEAERGRVQFRGRHTTLKLYMWLGNEVTCCNLVSFPVLVRSPRVFRKFKRKFNALERLEKLT